MGVGTRDMEELAVGDFITAQQVADHQSINNGKGLDFRFDVGTSVQHAKQPLQAAFEIAEIVGKVHKPGESEPAGVVWQPQESLGQPQLVAQYSIGQGHLR